MAVLDVRFDIFLVRFDISRPIRHSVLPTSLRAVQFAIRLKGMSLTGWTRNHQAGIQVFSLPSFHQDMHNTFA